MSPAYSTHPAIGANDAFHYIGPIYIHLITLRFENIAAIPAKRDSHSEDASPAPSTRSSYRE